MSSARVVATVTPANASLISHSSMSCGLQPLAREELGRGFGGAQVEGGVGAGDDGSPDDLGERLVACLSGSLRGGQDAGGGAIRELGGVARRDRALAREGGR